ncbi:hypothetical protein [Pseudomonas tolaasii]|uniref:hypothetical protein n=1 Tax=Pseudomonas tolaasii TaxID=29442 RepID=UPI0015A322CA|nr:hypothetical protein [Pseudomonas tolaasii]MBW1247235.1 hypothetical protein [Pseudomonas tolaasii]NVZ43032.1 hypothetical protein [Pseudomonas tolaasii]NWA50867.1 hypothetical protein [Pseudomonas tolaasii]NWC27476.1 hypothetical protein [Pseudomonas tolaasii]NWC54950.1 hypothetical protein [Pseudomonas tolaasii]
MENSEQDDERADLTDFVPAAKAATSTVTKVSINPFNCIEIAYELDCHSVFP